MKPAAFDYCAPRTLDEALGLLADAADDASPLAGGQSLVPMLSMRLARPLVLVDLNRVAGLGEVEPLPDGGLRLGAMVRQRTLERDPEVRRRAPLLPEVARHIAHLQIRTRGTVGGSLAHADPAAELPAAMLALDARMLVRAAGGAARTIPASGFFHGALTTALEPGELLAGVELPPLPPGAGCAFGEFAQVHGAFALAGVAAVVRTDAAGRIDDVRLALCGVGPVQHAPASLGELLVGEAPSTALFAEAGGRVRAETRELLGSHADAGYRSALAGALAARVLAAAAARSGREEAR